MGSGNDTFQWDPGDGSDTVEGESGTDALQFNGSNIGEEFNVSADGDRVRFTRNVAAIAMDVKLERINVRALAGTDNVTVGDLTGTGLKLVDVDESGFDGNGDAAKDNVIVNGTDKADRFTASSPAPGTALISGLAAKVQVEKAEATQDLVTVNGLGDNDTFNSDVTVTGPAAVVANGGEGTDTARYSGTADDDEVFFATAGLDIARVGTATSTGLDVVRGHGGDVDPDAWRQRHRRRAERHRPRHRTSRSTAARARTPARRRRRRQADRRHRRRPDRRQPRQRHRPRQRRQRPLPVGSGRRQRRRSTARATTTRSTSTAPTPARSSTCSPTASRARLTRNVATITMDFDNVEAVAIRALAGNDQILVDDLKGTDVSNVDVDLGAFGGGGDAAADVVEVGGSARRDKAEVRAENGIPVIVGPSVITRIHQRRAGDRHARGQHAGRQRRRLRRPARQDPDPDHRRPRDGRMIARRIAPAAVAAVLFVAGCGSSGGVSKNDYVKSLNEAVTSLQKSTASLGPDATSGGDAVKRLESGGKAMDVAAENFNNITPPDDAKHAHGADRRGPAQVRGHVPRRGRRGTLEG